MFGVGIPQIPGLETARNACNWVSTGAANLRDGIGTGLTNARDGAALRLATARVFTAEHSNHFRLGAYSAIALGTWYVSGDGSWLTYLAPTAVAATTDAFWNRHTVQQVGAEQLANAQQQLTRAGGHVANAYVSARDSDFVEQNRGYLTTAGYVAITAASWYLDGGWSSFFTTLAIGTVGAVRNNRELFQITFGQPNTETRDFIRDLRLLQDDATVSETIQPIPHNVVVRVHDQLRNFLIYPLPLTGNDRWINAENRQVLQVFADQLQDGIETNRSQNPIDIPPDTRAQLGHVLQFVIECEQAQIGCFLGPSVSTAPFIAQQQEYLRQFTYETRTYSREDLQRTVGELEQLIADPSPLVGTVSIPRQLMGNGPWQEPLYQRQYQLLQTGIQQLLDGEPPIGDIFRLSSHVRSAFAGAIDVCDQIRVSQQTYPQQVLDAGIRRLPERAQRIARAGQSAYNATDTTNAVQRPASGLMILHHLLGDTSREFTVEDYVHFIRNLNGEYSGLGTHIVAEFGGTTPDVSTLTFRGEFRDAVTRAINAYTPTLERETQERYEACEGRLDAVVRPDSTFAAMPREWQVASQYSLENNLIPTASSNAVADTAVAVGRAVVDYVRGVETPVVRTPNAETSGGGGGAETSGSGGLWNAVVAAAGAVVNEVLGRESGTTAIINAIMSGDMSAILDSITRAFSTLPGSFASGASRVFLTGLISALNSDRINAWIAGQESAEARDRLRANLRETVTFLDQVQANPIATVQALGGPILAQLGVTDPDTITTDDQAIRLAANYLRSRCSNNVILVNGFAIPFLNTAEPVNNLTATQSRIRHDLESLSLTENVPNTPEARAAQSRVLDEELSVQKETFVKNATAFAAFQLVEWAIGSPNSRGAIDTAIRAELQNRPRPLLESDPTYYSALDALRRYRGYYQTRDVFKAIMGEIHHHSPENQLSEFKCRYKERIDERPDLNWIQKKFAKVFLSFSMWGFGLVLKNSMNKLTSFAYDRMHAVDGAVQINITPIQGLKNFLMGIHRGQAQWVADTTNAGTAPQNPLLDRDPYMDRILRQKEFNQNYTADELNATLGDVLVDNFFPDLSWSSGINNMWNKLYSWCNADLIDSSSSWAPMNLLLKGLKWIPTSPAHLLFGILSVITRVFQGGASVVFKYGAKKALRDTGLVSNILESSRGSLYENSPYNIAMNKIVLEQLQEVYKELRRPPEGEADTTRVRVAEPSSAQLDEILGLIDNLFEVQRTVHCRTPAELREHLQNNGGYFEQLTTGLRRAFQGAYEPQVKEQIGKALMVVYKSFLQPNQIKKQLAAILEVSNNAMTVEIPETAEIPEEERRQAAARGASIEAEIKGVRDNILRTMIDQAINEQVSQLGQTEVRVTTETDDWMSDALVNGYNRRNDVNGTTEWVTALIPQWTDSLERYEDARTPREKQEALDQIKTDLSKYNDTLQMKMINVRTYNLNAQTQNLLQNRAHAITLRLRSLVNEFVPLFNYQRIEGTNQSNSNTIQLINDHFNDIQTAIGDIQVGGTQNFESLTRILSRVLLVRNFLAGLGDNPSTNPGVNNLVREIREITNGLNAVGEQLETAAHNSIVLNRITATELRAYIEEKQSNLAAPTPIFGRSSSSAYHRLHHNLKQSIGALPSIQGTVLRRKLDAIHLATTPEQIGAPHDAMNTFIQELRDSQDTSIRLSLEASNSSIGEMRGRATGIMSQTNTTPERAQEMTDHIAAARTAIANLNGHLTDGQRLPITFSNADVVSSDSAILARVGDYIFNEMRRSTDRLLLMAKKGYLFEGAIRHAVILPVITQAGLSRL